MQYWQKIKTSKKNWTPVHKIPKERIDQLNHSILDIPWPKFDIFNHLQSIMHELELCICNSSVYISSFIYQKKKLNFHYDFEQCEFALNWLDSPFISLISYMFLVNTIICTTTLHVYLILNREHVCTMIFLTLLVLINCHNKIFFISSKYGHS